MFMKRVFRKTISPPPPGPRPLLLSFLTFSFFKKKINDRIPPLFLYSFHKPQLAHDFAFSRKTPILPFCLNFSKAIFTLRCITFTNFFFYLNGILQFGLTLFSFFFVTFLHPIHNFSPVVFNVFLSYET